MIKKSLSIMIAMATIISLFCCIPVNAASNTTPFMYCDFNDGEAVNDFFGSANNANVTDSIVAGVAGSDGAFQRSYNLNTVAAAYLIPKSNSFSPDLFSGTVKVSFWFKIDPTVGTLLTTASAPLTTLHPRFYVTSNNKELQANTYTKTGWDTEALNRGEWVYIEMTSNANGAFAGYTLQSTDTISLQLRLNGVSNTANRGWTNTNCIAYAIDDFKIEKVVDAYDSTAEGAAEYAYPWAENLAISGKLESNGAWGTHYDHSDRVKQGDTISADNKVTLSYTYNSNDTATAEGASLVRVMRETAAGSNKFAVIQQFTRTNSNSFEYQLSEDWIGRRMKMEVVPVDANGVYGAPCSVVSEPVKSAADPSIRLSFDESTETGSGAFFMGRADATDTSVRGAIGSGSALKREATISASCTAPFLQHVFTANPKELFMGNFKISLWFKLNADVTQLDTTKVSQLMVVMQKNGGSSWNLQIPFNGDVNAGEWMYLECDAYATNRFNGVTADFCTAADDQQYTMTVRVGTYSNINNTDIITSDGNILSYCIDDFKIEKIVDSYSSTASAYGRPYVTGAAISGNMVSGSDLEVSYNYNIDRAANTESDNSIIRVLRETAVGSNMYGLVKSYIKKEFLEEGYTLTDAWLDKKMKVEIIPVATDGTYGATYTAVSDPVKLEYQVSTTLSDLAETITATASVLNNYRDGKDDPMVLYIVVYDSNNKMIKLAKNEFVATNTVATAQTATAIEKTLTATLTAEELAAASKVKAFLWSNDGAYTPILNEKVK